MKYFEAFGEGGYHSAFMTTYAFGALAFEDIPFPKLRGAGCKNITVLADRAMVNQAFADFGPPRFAGTSYHLVKSDAPGAFHPKITLLIGENKGRLIVGSANLTALGLGGNKEQVASITYSPDSPENARFFIAALDYIHRYVPQDDEWFPISLKRTLRSSPWLRDDGYNPIFSGNGVEELNFLFDRPEINLLDQIIASLGDDPIERLVIVSPYWDSRLEGVARLKAGLGNPSTDILIGNDTNGFPSDELSRFSNVALFDVRPSAAGRFLHAKLIIAQGKNWDHIVSGSMNCTLPALMGPVADGNAEAAIYRRVARNSALEALDLLDYQNAPMRYDQIAQLQQFFEEPKTTEIVIDGGTLTLQSGKISWTAPTKMKLSALNVQLYDREGIPQAQIEVNGKNSAIYMVPPDGARPKYGVLNLANDIISAPIQIADLDCLTITTLPTQRGRKKQLSNALAESLHEDLILIETLNQLEELEEEDRAAHPTQFPRIKPDANNNDTHEYQALPYEEYIRARTLANDRGKLFGTYLNSRHDRPTNLLSLCLNQMIELVSSDLKGMEERDFQSLSDIDLDTTEPQPYEDKQDFVAKPHSESKNRSEALQNLATAKKFQEAVTTFEKRSRALADKNITTSEMVRLRALIQIILSYAQPVSGSHLQSQILPVYNAQGHDWPRLIGRLLRQHFEITRALQSLSVEPDEAEQERVLEYLAFSNWAVRAAHAAVMSEKKAAVVKGSLERMIGPITSQTQTILSMMESDKEYYEKIYKKIDERFKKRLGLVPEPGPTKF